MVKEMIIGMGKKLNASEVLKMITVYAQIFHDVDFKAYEILVDRDQAYGHSFRAMTPEHCAWEIRQKADRILRGNCDYEDEFIDISNYARFGHFNYIHGVDTSDDRAIRKLLSTIKIKHIKDFVKEVISRDDEIARALKKLFKEVLE